MTANKPPTGITSTLGRAEITQVFCEKLSLDKKTASNVLETLVDSLVDRFKQGKSLKIQGLGTFAVHEKKSRPGLNPKTKEKVTVPSRRVVRMRPSPTLQKRLNDDV
ncbi:HU family DNA-binding protein [Candidatus Finniella inopinata]|uniref:HU family DNA-binding protein n=1 Tax=Candidatus Finniella inopinata TaxID=1696036 RepID=UPI0013EE5FC5|nr:HU family DNA-binding protein [Candidatus Finniella inopinata]